MRIRFFLTGVATMAILSPLAMAAAARTTAPSAIARAAAPDPNTSYIYRILNNPISGDEIGLRNLGLQPRAQQVSDKLFGALQPLLGGAAPQLNDVPTGSPLLEYHLSANAASGTINADPLALAGLIDNNSPNHDGAVNQFPHEMAHLRQTADVLASIPVREGGAQAFADLVTPVASQRAGIPYTPGPPGNFDGDYAAYVRQAQQAPYGRDWLLSGQFGRPPVTWP